MRKLLSTLLALSLALSLGACAVKVDPTGPDAPKPSQPETPELTFAVGTPLTHESTYTADDGTLLLHTNYELPQLELRTADGALYEPGAAATQSAAVAVRDAFNAEMERCYAAVLSNESELAQEARDHYGSDSMSFEYIYYEDELLGEVVYQTDGLISVLANAYAFYGGAHPNTSTLTWSFDLTTGEFLTLDSLDAQPSTDSALGESLTHTLAMAVLEQIDAQGLSEYYFEDYASYIFDLAANASFYFNGKGLTIVFDPAVIAPYAASAQKFEIPYSRFYNALDSHTQSLLNVPQDEIIIADYYTTKTLWSWFNMTTPPVDSGAPGITVDGLPLARVTLGDVNTLDELRAQGFKAFYVAIGCQGGRLAGIPGEDAEDVTVAVDFLREVNSGKIDALPGRTIVVGGGNVAIDVARNACRLGSEHVEMFCLESEAQMPASEEERREAIEDGAHISCGWGPKEVHLDEAGRVCGITFKRCTRVFDDEGRFAPEYDENDLRRVDADRVIMSIGQSIVWGDLLAGSKVELGRGQGALADPQTYQTAEPDIFVGGDVYTGPSFAIDAIAAGHEAAVSIHRFVQPGSTLTIGRNQRRYTALDRDDVVLESYDNASREVAHVDREREKAAPFSEYVETFTEEQVRAETARCLGCGASIVDPNKCIGCGVCTTKCEFDAIHLHRDLPECSKMVKSEDKFKAILPYMAKREIKIRFAKKEK